MSETVAMTSKELEREYESVDRAMTHNLKVEEIQPYMVRGIWQIALQLAKLNEGVEKCQ
jgi:hypothetical protein